MGQEAVDFLMTRRCAVIGCDGYPLHGFGVRLGKGQFGTWLCSEHVRSESARGLGAARAPTPTFFDSDPDSSLPLELARRCP